MSQLSPGDIVIFKAGDDWIGKSIAWLTDSDVSHAAVMLEGGQMAEMGPSGIHVGVVEAREGNGAILLRLNPEVDPAPVVAAAQKYISCETRYDFPALAILAGLIIYRRIRPTQRLVAITDILLRGACSVLDQLIQRVVLKNPGKAMVCSQLAYQVYDDCGKGYRISINNGLLQLEPDIAPGGGLIRLADVADKGQGLDFAAAPGEPVPSDDYIAKELYQALAEAESVDCSTAPGLNSLPQWCGRFIERLEEFLEKSGNLIPLDALFVTPADLAYKSTNLRTVGHANVARLP